MNTLKHHHFIFAPLAFLLLYKWKEGCRTNEGALTADQMYVFKKFGKITGKLTLAQVSFASVF